MHQDQEIGVKPERVQPAALELFDAFQFSQAVAHCRQRCAQAGVRHRRAVGVEARERRSQQVHGEKQRTHYFRQQGFSRGLVPGGIAQQAQPRQPG